MAATLTRTSPAAATSRPAALATGRVLQSEWTKIRSVRSTFWTLVVTIAGTIGIGAAVCAAFVSRYNQLSAADRLTVDPAGLSLVGINFAQLALGVLGVLVISSEYSTGMIRSTFAAVPQRGVVLWAKAAVFAAVALVVGMISSFIAFFVGQTILSGQSIQTTIGAPGVLRSVIGGGLYLAVLGLLALGLGALIRRTAGGIAALFGLILVLPGITAALPQSWQHVIVKILPSEAGQQVMSVHRQAHALGPWAGFGVFCAWAAAAVVAAVLVTAHRDA
ncbi:MAG: ABC transporter permease [Acidimicrobiales bacterium]